MGAGAMKVQADWLNNPSVQVLFALLGDAGQQLHAVGGCVRNTLLGQPVADVDFACSARPEVVSALAKAAGYRVLPTGIEHGTVTVLIGDEGFEVTTWRKDVDTDGRRATVAYAETLREDALRRDFTMNALYVSADGSLTDPVGGQHDIAAKRLRFIGNADDRIAEDCLRILRFFRFYAWYCDPSDGPDPDALAAIAAGLDGLASLSAERVGAEMARLLAAPNPAPALGLMAQSGALGRVLPGADVMFVAPLVHVEGETKTPPRWQRRLAALGQGEDWAARLRLSRADAKALVNTALAAGTDSLAVAAYLYGEDAAVDATLITAASTNSLPKAGWRDEVLRGVQAEFSLRAVDFPQLAGPALGAALKAAQARWLASDLRADRATLLGD